MVTGGAYGIGRAICLRLSEAGASIYAIDISEKGLERLKDEIEELGGKRLTFSADISKKEEIDAFWEFIKEGPDIPVNNVGVYWMKPFEEVDDELLKRVFEINFYSAWRMSQHFVRRKREGGVIVNMGSIEGVLPFREDLAHYSATKAAIMSLTRSLAREYGKKKFRVNAVVPGGIMTEGVKKLARDLGLKAISEGRNI